MDDAALSCGANWDQSIRLVPGWLLAESLRQGLACTPHLTHNVRPQSYYRCQLTSRLQHENVRRLWFGGRASRTCPRIGFCRCSFRAVMLYRSGFIAMEASDQPNGIALP